MLDGPRKNGDRDQLLNAECFCITLDQPSFLSALRAEAVDPQLASALLAARPHLFSQGPVFVGQRDLQAMEAVAAAVESVVADRAYQDAVLQWAPEIAAQDFGPRGAFMGYDFHLGPEGPRLIEVNTNAGGAFLNALLARAQTACCREAADAMEAGPGAGFEDSVWEMFLAEWAYQGCVGQPSSVAIVDDAPEEQYLYPEFLLAKRFFERRGMAAIVADPADLEYSDGKLRWRGQAIDMVYNRLVDFSLEEERHSALRTAYLAGSIVLTPNPRNHALFADKRNLTLLSDPAHLGRLAIDAQQRRSLLAVLPTQMVTAENAELLWETRKRYFFKPWAGYGGKAVYRGDKLTRRVWDDIQNGGYIAQELAAPSLRRAKVQGAVTSLKLDVRLYTYRGATLICAARVYQGQTTNFRTPGGGFAPVFSV